MTARTHEEYKDNVAAYVLGALPELEVEIFERHVAGCDSCRAEVEELRPVAHAMARSVPQVEPPPSLKASLMQVVNAEAALRAPAAARDNRSAARPQRRSFAEWVAGLQPRTALASAMAVLAIGVGVGVAIDEAGNGNSSSRTISAMIDRKVMPTGTASLALTGSHAKLDLTGAPQPPSGRVYQLWYRRGSTIERGGTFRPRADGSYEASLSVPGTDAVMVTVERAGGAPAPTGPPVLQFNT